MTPAAPQATRAQLRANHPAARWSESAFHPALHGGAREWLGDHIVEQPTRERVGPTSNCNQSDDARPFVGDRCDQHEPAEEVWAIQRKAQRNSAAPMNAPRRRAW